MNTVFVFLTYHLFNNINKTLEILIWPIVVLIIFLILKGPIKDFINRIKKIGFNGAGVETIFTDNQVSEDKSPIDKLRKENPSEFLDKIKGLFNASTIQVFEDAVVRESQVDTVKDIHEREKVLFNYSQIMYLMAHFDKIYSLIFGSQINILQRLNTSVFENKESLKSFYDSAKLAFPKTYENYSYDNYYDFLLEFHLIVVEESQTKITILGKDFLKYLIESGFSFYKLN